MLLQQFLSLRWTCQALIWSLCGKYNRCYTYHRWLGLIEAIEWISWDDCVCLMFSKKAETFFTWHLKCLEEVFIIQTLPVFVYPVWKLVDQTCYYYLCNCLFGFVSLSEVWNLRGNEILFFTNNASLYLKVMSCQFFDVQVFRLLAQDNIQRQILHKHCFVF